MCILCLVVDMIPAAKMALLWFIFSHCTFLTCFFSGILSTASSELYSLKYWGPGFYFCLINFFLKYFYTGFIYEVTLRAAGLGGAMAFGFFLITFNNGWRVLGFYVVALSFFHFSEFMAVAMTNPKTVTIDSFILNHSVQYALAAAASWLEWALEFYLYPELKSNFGVSCFGIFMCVVGELLRKSAMFTAKTNFTHTVQFVKRPEHRLVTHGVYSACRHPSYVGWFLWSVGTQVILLNPLCLAIYTGVSWAFFRERVYAEEMTLLSFFGREYEAYQKEVGTGLPFIHGCHKDDKRRDMRADHWSY